MPLNPSKINLPSPKAGDKRIAEVLGTKVGKNPKIVFIGFCSDTGVKRNNGRLGAKSGPEAIREQFLRLSPDCFFDLMSQSVDLGNLEVGENLETAQEELGKIVADQLSKGVHPIVFGGGHETSFGHFLGYAQSKKRTEIINIDSHADVRPFQTNNGHSGSVFRQALEHSSGSCQGYSVYGLARHVLNGASLEYIREKKIEHIFADEFQPHVLAAKLSMQKGPRFVSFDLDGLDQSYAPGVSSPTAGGMGIEDWLKVAFLTGASTSVTSMDIVELNPQFDCDHCTARNAALTVWNYLRGFSKR